jgi:hypothetical protein
MSTGLNSSGCHRCLCQPAGESAIEITHRSASWNVIFLTCGIRKVICNTPETDDQITYTYIVTSRNFFLLELDLKTGLLALQTKNLYHFGADDHKDNRSICSTNKNIVF